MLSILFSSLYFNKSPLISILESSYNPILDSFILFSSMPMILDSLAAFSAKLRFIVSLLNCSLLSLTIGPTIFMFDWPFSSTLIRNALFRNLSEQSYNPILKDPLAHCTCSIASMSLRSLFCLSASLKSFLSLNLYKSRYRPRAVKMSSHTPMLSNA